MTLLLMNALAFDSTCKNSADEVCDYGLEPARGRWNHPFESEHYDLFVEALELSGIPTEINDAITFRTWTTGEAVPDAPTVESIAPVLIDAGGSDSRTMEPAEFSQLPDFSYGVYDWVSGNETCLAFDGSAWATDVDTCHKFTTHSGALNSSHFLPQARGFYEHYHQLALQRAAECRPIWDQLAGTPYEHHALACEQEALVFEAVAQHYLQDAWSIGHMWERFGGPEIDDWNEGLGPAQVVAAMSGLVHGAKAVVSVADDPMCGPHHSAVYEDWETEQIENGMGDLFVDTHLFSSTYEPQRTALLGCSVNSMREVYEATGMGHGEPIPVAWSELDDRDPRTDQCWGQRATNHAFATGWGLHVGTTPNQIPVFTAAPPSSQLGFMAASWSSLLVSSALNWVNTSFNGGMPLSPLQKATFRADVAANTMHVMLEAWLHPEATNLANGDLFSILGAKPNGTYERGGQGDLSQLPADYVDIAGPWSFDSTDSRGVALNLGFLDSHAPDRCSTLTEQDLDRYVAAVQNAPEGTRGARCTQCAAMLEPHMRAGTGPADYSEYRETLCAYTGNSPTFKYSGDRQPGPSATLAARLCGCAEGLGIVTRDSGDDDISFANRFGTSLELRGDYFPTGESPRDAAIGGTGNQLFVTAGEHVAVYVVTEGDEHEVDTDDDLQTETPGAPVGVTRINVGGPPRGIALQHTGRYGLVATADEIVVIDQRDLAVVASYTKSFLGFHSKEKPYDIAIRHDDQKAFVTAYGSYPHVANEVHVLDLSDLPHNLELETTFITGGDTQNQFLEISPSGEYLAVTCPEIDYVNVYNTSDYSLVGRYIEEGFEQAHYPIAVEWSLDSKAIYVGYLSGPYNTSLSGNGVVRKCYLDEAGNCEHAVGVENSVRDLLVTPEGIVWVGDDGGNLTPLSPELFDPGLTTSGKNQQTGLYDGTGGCLDANVRAEPCPPAANAGRAVGALVEF